MFPPISFFTALTADHPAFRFIVLAILFPAMHDIIAGISCSAAATHVRIAAPGPMFIPIKLFAALAANHPAFRFIVLPIAVPLMPDICTGTRLAALTANVRIVAIGPMFLPVKFLAAPVANLPMLCVIITWFATTVHDIIAGIGLAAHNAYARVAIRLMFFPHSFFAASGANRPVFRVIVLPLTGGMLDIIPGIGLAAHSAYTRIVAISVMFGSAFVYFFAARGANLPMFRFVILVRATFMPDIITEIRLTAEAAYIRIIAMGEMCTEKDFSAVALGTSLPVLLFVVLPNPVMLNISIGTRLAAFYAYTRLVAINTMYASTLIYFLAASGANLPVL